MFYLFDKKLRLLVLDIIERFEIHLRTTLAHEIGRINPLAYQDKDCINPINIQKSRFQKWRIQLNDSLLRRRAGIVKHHLLQKPLPFWAIVEIWDFGMLSKYYSMLNRNFPNVPNAHLNSLGLKDISQLEILNLYKP